MSIIRQNPFLLGLSFLLSWVSTLAWELREGASMPHVAAFYLSMSAFMVAQVLLDNFLRRLGKSRVFDFFGCLSLVAASLLILSHEWPSLDPFNVSPVIVCILGGLGCSWACMRWSIPYSRLGVSDSLVCTGFSIVIAACLNVVLSVGGNIVTCIGLIVVSFLLFGALNWAFGNDPQDELPVPGPTEFAHKATLALPLWRLALSVVVYSFALGVSWSLLLDTPMSTTRVSEVSPCLVELSLGVCLLVCVVVFRMKVSFVKCWRAIVLLVSAAILFAPQVDGTAYEFCFSFVRAAQMFVMALWFLALTDVSRKIHLGAPHVAGMGWLFYFLPMAAGIFFGLALSAINPLDTLLPSLTVLALVFVAFVADDVSLPEGDLLCSQTQEFPQVEDKPQVDDKCFDLSSLAIPLDPRREPDRITSKCLDLANEYGLTKRELEVLVHLAHGRSGSYIASELTLSENTVKGHTKRLYAKLGIHNRQELINLAEQAGDDRPQV